MCSAHKLVDTGPLCLLMAWLVGLAAAGCANRPVNPSFAISENDARAAIKQIEEDARPLDRPVVVLAGWADPGFMNSFWVDQLRCAGVPREKVVGLKFTFKGGFDACRRHVIDAVQQAWPSHDAVQTVEVDVVAFSMGGLVARYSAMPSSTAPEGRKLNIRNLYTISTPHRGAAMAAVPTWDRRVIDMRSGSAFLASLDAAAPEAGYALVPYTRLDDPIIDSTQTAPPGVTPWWVDCPPLHRSHQEAYRDPRIRADILRRLRGEKPLTQEPAADFPE